MKSGRYDLPEDDAELRRFTCALLDELRARDLKIQKLLLERAAANRARFGRSSEKLGQPVAQFLLGIEEAAVPEALAGIDDATDSDMPAPAGANDNPSARAARPRPPRGRRPLPAHAPVEEVLLPVCACRHCGSDRLSKIKDDRRQLLEYVPASYKIIEYVRPKMSCRMCERITQAPMPALPIERGRAGPNLIAHIATSKYGDHIPLERQSKIMARAGIRLSRKALCGYLSGIAPLLAPLAQTIGDHVRAADVFHIDDTPMPVLERGRGQTREGRLFCLVRDESPWGSASPPAIFYAHAPDKLGCRVDEVLGNAWGYMHADADTRFTHLYNPKVTDRPMLEVACWAHARRRFYEAWRSNNSPGAGWVLRRMKELFAIEREIRGMAPAQRLARRERDAVPILVRLKAFLDWARAAGSRIMPIAEATEYMLARWRSFTRYVTDGRLEMTNNAVERAIKPCVLGRRNYLFQGSDAGGVRSAIFYTLIETARANGIDPMEYLSDVIARIGAHPINRIDELLPWCWKAAREERRAA